MSLRVDSEAIQSVTIDCHLKLIRIVSFSQQWEKRIVAKERSAFAKQNTKTRLTATTKQGGRSSVEGLFLFTLTEILFNKMWRGGVLKRTGEDKFHARFIRFR